MCSSDLTYFDEPPPDTAYWIWFTPYSSTVPKKACFESAPTHQQHAIETQAQALQGGLQRTRARIVDDVAKLASKSRFERAIGHPWRQVDANSIQTRSRCLARERNRRSTTYAFTASSSNSESNGWRRFHRRARPRHSQDYGAVVGTSNTATLASSRCGFDSHSIHLNRCAMFLARELPLATDTDASRLNDD